MPAIHASFMQFFKIKVLIEIVEVQVLLRFYKEIEIEELFFLQVQVDLVCT